MPKEFNNDLAPADSADRVLIMREGSPDLSGYIEIADLITKVQLETTATSIIVVNELTDLQPYLSGGEYVIPAGYGLKFVKDITLASPIRLPTAAPTVIIGDLGGTGFIRVTYSDTGTFIRGTSGCPGLILQNLNLIQGGVSAQLIDIQNGATSSNWAAFCLLLDVFLTNWSNLGLIEGASLGLFRGIAMIGVGTGLECRHWGSLGIHAIAWASGQNLASARVFEFKNVMSRVALIGPNSFILGTNESVLKIDAAVTTNGISIAWNSITGGALFASGSLTETSTGVLALNNSGLADSPTTFRPATLTNAAAPNNSVYYSSTSSKLVYKDSGGTVNLLY